MKSLKQKLYCYVDETGQDTQGLLFIVSIVITKSDRDEIRKFLEEIEVEVGKKETKWHRTTRSIKIVYIQKISQIKLLQNKVFYSLTNQSNKYNSITLSTIASSINQVKDQSEYEAAIFIDGLRRSEVGKVGTGLRRIGVATEKIRGIRDESDALVRLADAIAGLVRENYEGFPFAKNLYKKCIRNKILQEVSG